MNSTSTRQGFDKRILVGIVLVLVVVAGVFAYTQFAATPVKPTERQTVTVRIDIKAINEDSHVFDPATVTVHKGDHVVLIVTNIDENAKHGIWFSNDSWNKGTGPLAPGQSTKVEFNADTEGTFAFYCSVSGCAPDHAQMIGQLIVVA